MPSPCEKQWILRRFTITVEAQTIIVARARPRTGSLPPEKTCFTESILDSATARTGLPSGRRRCRRTATSIVRRLSEKLGPRAGRRTRQPFSKRASVTVSLLEAPDHAFTFSRPEPSLLASVASHTSRLPVVSKIKTTKDRANCRDSALAATSFQWTQFWVSLVSVFGIAPPEEEVFVRLPMGWITTVWAPDTPRRRGCARRPARSIHRSPAR